MVFGCFIVGRYLVVFFFGGLSGFRVGRGLLGIRVDRVV